MKKIILKLFGFIQKPQQGYHYKETSPNVSSSVYPKETVSFNDVFDNVHTELTKIRNQSRLKQ